MKKFAKEMAVVFGILILMLGLSACGSSERDEEPVVDWDSNVVSNDGWYDSSSVERVTQLEVTNSGKLNIVREMRDNEVPMGDDGTWSVFVYLCGADLESDAGCATLDLEEMMKVGSTDKLNVIVQTGGARSWDTRGISAKKLQRFKVNKGSLEFLCEGTNDSMGSSDTLYNFLSWGVENYPAEHMAVIFWDHGSGSINGVCFDEKHNDDSLYLTEIEEALTKVYSQMTCRFEFVGFDACLMATVETANMLVPHAKYLIASEELESGYGWDYKAFLNYIYKNPDCDGRDVGETICRSYYSYCEYTGEEDDATMSVVDLSKLDNFLVAFNNVSELLAASTGNMSDLSQISRAISKAENYGGNNQSEGYTNMVDLGDILKNLSGVVDGSDKALSLLKETVVYKINGDNCPKSNGLAIYYPLSVQGSEELNILRNICVSPYYMSFVETMAYGSSNGTIDDYNADDWSDSDYYYQDNFGFNDYWNNDDNNGYYDGWDDWFNNSSDNGWYNTDSDTIMFEVEPYVNNYCYYTMIIDQDSLDYVQAIYFALFKDEGNDELVYLGNDNAVSYDLDTGEVYDCFMGEWPQLPDGQCVAIYLVDEGENFNIYSIPILLNDKEMSLRVKMVYDEDEVFGDFSVIGVWEGINDNGQAGRGTDTIEKGDIIRPLYEVTNCRTGEESMRAGKEYKVGSKFNISVGVLPDADYYYSYEIVDIFGSSMFTSDAIFTVEDGELFGYPDEDADEYDSYFSDGFSDNFSSNHDSVWNLWDLIFGDDWEDDDDDDSWWDDDDDYYYWDDDDEDSWWDDDDDDSWWDDDDDDNWWDDDDDDDDISGWFWW